MKEIPFGIPLAPTRFIPITTHEIRQSRGFPWMFTIEKLKPAAFDREPAKNVMRWLARQGSNLRRSG